MTPWNRLKMKSSQLSPTSSIEGFETHFGWRESKTPINADGPKPGLFMVTKRQTKFKKACEYRAVLLVCSRVRMRAKTFFKYG